LLKILLCLVPKSTTRKAKKKDKRTIDRDHTYLSHTTTQRKKTAKRR
jgi:hypothetical protein